MLLSGRVRFRESGQRGKPAGPLAMERVLADVIAQGDERHGEEQRGECERPGFLANQCGAI